MGRREEGGGQKEMCAKRIVRGKSDVSAWWDESKKRCVEEGVREESNEYMIGQEWEKMEVFMVVKRRHQ